MPKQFMTRSCPFLLVTLLYAGLTAGDISASEVYKCVSADGTVSFSNNPFCPEIQAYARNRQEPLLQVNPVDLAKIPADEKIELHYDRVDLADLIETIGAVAGIPFETIGLEGTYISIEQPPKAWSAVFDDLALRYNLDYRKAYGKIYVYMQGTMGETIVHHPDMLRWYQSAETWDVVLKHDTFMLAMKAYEDSTLADRLPNLLKRVREELDEKAHINAAEAVTLKETSSAGVGGSIAAARSQQEFHEREAEKRRRIIQRRQSNNGQSDGEGQARCFSSGIGC